MTDQTTPSQRAGLRDEIVQALGRIKTVPPIAHRREQADHVLAVLYRLWPWLRAEAEDAAPGLSPAACPDREPLLGVQCTKEAGHEAHSGRPGRIWYPAPDDEAPQPEVVCICGHPEQQHFEDVCFTKCGCGDFLTAEAAAEEITRLRQIVGQRKAGAPVRVETLARLLCDADNALTDGPSWERISQTPGLGRDEYRNAARYLLRRVTVTQALDEPAALLCGDQIPDMTCTLPDGPHDDWKHRDEEGHWWSQMRIPPHSNRDRLAAEAAVGAQQPKEEA